MPDLSEYRRLADALAAAECVRGEVCVSDESDGVKDACRFRASNARMELDVYVERLAADAERLDWLLSRLTGRALRDAGVVYSEGNPEAKRAAIDDARAERIIALLTTPEHCPPDCECREPMREAIRAEFEQTGRYHQGDLDMAEARGYMRGLSATPEPQPASGESVQALALRLYEHHTSHGGPYIPWRELSDLARVPWINKASRMSATPEPQPAPPSSERWIVLFDVQGRVSTLAEDEEGDTVVFHSRAEAERAVEGHILESFHRVIPI
jgi:hypothetical protein